VGIVTQKKFDKITGDVTGDGRQNPDGVPSAFDQHPANNTTASANMSVSIKVAIRCRPYTIDDKLGVKLRQISEEEGEVELINSDYSTSRFPFTYCWWSAYGYKRRLQGDNLQDADDMQLIDQQEAYRQCGLKIKSDLLGGNAVVLFAYGLSGSGKTYTVFGPDAIDAPEAWFKHSEPQPLWGILPRLAYELFQEKTDGWKVSMKYFQNVVDIVRDLMSNSAEEQHYKNGMRKDPDGFMDIEWCGSTVVHSWDDFRKVFMQANARKAIAPTQFNPMSTRGHCIMLLEVRTQCSACDTSSRARRVSITGRRGPIADRLLPLLFPYLWYLSRGQVEMPNPEVEGTKQRGRVYVCDLAGTEPAGDIVYAVYNKVNFDDGSFEYQYQGAHSDLKKTKVIALPKRLSQSLVIFRPPTLSPRPHPHCPVPTPCLAALTRSCRSKGRRSTCPSPRWPNSS